MDTKKNTLPSEFRVAFGEGYAPVTFDKSSVGDMGADDNKNLVPYGPHTIKYKVGGDPMLGICFHRVNFYYCAPPPPSNLP